MTLPYDSVRPNETLGHLKLLAIFHYVLGGITALFSCFAIIYIVIGVAFLNGSIPQPANQPPTPAGFGWIFVVMGSVFLLLGWTLAALMLIAARKLQTQRSRTFCMVVAGIQCIFVPLGTVLGIFTLIVLSKPEAKILFDARTPAR